MFKRVFALALAWAAVFALGASFALAQDSPPTAPQPAPQAASQRSDGQIEMDVVHALDASKALSKDLITAATIQSEVTLSGTVSSDASKQLAESIASHVPGVTAVHNNLKVGNPLDAQAAPQAGEPGVDPMAENQSGYDDGPAPPPQGYPQQGPGQYPDQSQAPMPPPQGDRPQYPQARPQYAPAQPPAPTYEMAKGPVTLLPGTLVQARTNRPVDSKHAKDGTPLEFTVIQDILIGNILAIPRGATLRGVVTEAKQSGALTGSPVLALTLTSLELGGQSYPLETDQFKVKGPGKGGATAGRAIGTGIMGTIIGCAVGGGTGCAIGAGAGVAAGTAASAASPGPGIWIPAEAQVDFHLKAPVTFNPVNAQEAARLGQGLFQGGPSLYRRGYYPYGRPYPAAYPYGYPQVYYRPYYITGGYYYWR
jgi:hypothetical protein